MYIKLRILFSLISTNINIEIKIQLPEPILSGSSSPVSILARMVLEHFRNASSTLSPVLALVSKNIKSFSCANLVEI